VAKRTEQPEHPEQNDQPEPIMHTGIDTSPGQRDLAVGEQIAVDAGQIPGPADEAEAEAEADEREITDTVSGHDL
jgi:hypothetical protein